MSGNSRNTKFLSKLLPGKKNKQRNSSALTMERTSSNQSPIRLGDSITNIDAFCTLPHRGRAHTVGNGTELSRPSINDKRSRSTAAVLTHAISGEIYSYTPKEIDMQMTLASPRHFLRRGGMVQDQLEGHLYSSKLVQQCSEDDCNSDLVTVCFEEERSRMKDSVTAKQTQSLRDIVDFLCIKNNLFLNNDLDKYHITATRSGSPVAVNLDLPSTNYTSCVVEIRSTNQEADASEKDKICVFQTVQDCINFFDAHGLEELPLPLGEDEDSYRLPRVQQMDPIARSWAELPIDPEIKDNLTKKELEQQQAIWEFIYTEHSHLRNLDVIINIFMRCLELIRRAKLLTEDGYHNVFGYMEYIYNAHERFWTYTLEPCLDKVYETRKPLDLGLIFDRFPEEFGTHFEIYEQHCALEKINLTNLNRAMLNPEFMAYLKWCEARPECNRLDLKAYLAKPMQRLTKYPLLISAISKKTTDPLIKQRLDQIWRDIHEFVDQVNSGVQAQEETERVKDAMSRITAYQVVEVPSELKDVVNQYTHLDLLAPMPDVEVDKQRMLIVEGSLKYRDHSNTRMVVHIFLFTDVMLVTKPIKKGGDKFAIVRPPYKIASLVLSPLEPGSFLVIELNDFHVLTSWFILKAHTSDIAKKWMDHINTAQQLYTEAVERKVQNWNYLQTLRSERILNGIDHNEALSTSLSNSLWSINNLSGGRLRGSISTSNECLMGKRGSTPSTRNGGRHPPITRTTSVGLHSDPKNNSSQRLNGFTEFGSNPSLYPESTSSMDQLALERTSSLGKLTEKPYKEHNMTMKTISETQLGGMFSDEDFNSDIDGNPASNHRRDDQHATEELCSIDESLTSDDCSTQGSDTHITNSEIIDAAATAINKSALRSERSMPPLSKNLSPPKSPNISPLHHKLQSSLSIESREGLHGASISPTHLTTSGNSPSHLKSILRSPSNSITSLSSISPTHSTFDTRVMIHTPPMPSTPTLVSADRAHSMLLEGNTAAHSHTIVPTSNNDASKNEKSPSPSPSMDLEVVVCKTVVGDGQLLSPKRELQSRSNSDTSVDSMRGGLQFHVTFVNDMHVRNSNISTLIEEDAATDGTTSPTVLSPKDHQPLPIIRQSSDSMIMSPQEVNSRPHRVMFSECTQVRSFESESDIDDRINIIHDDSSMLDLMNAESEQSEAVVNRHTTDEANGPLESPLDKCSQVSDEMEPHEPSSSEPQQATSLPTSASSSATDSKARVGKDSKEHTRVKKSGKAEKTAKVPPAHKRVTGKGVRALSQMFEGVPSSKSASPVPPESSTESSPVHQPSRKVPVSKIPLPCGSPVLDGPKLVKNHPGEGKEQATRNNLKVGSSPPKVPTKPTKGAPSSTGTKRKITATEKVASTPDQSPATVKRVMPARKSSVCQQRAGVSTKSTTSIATRRASRVEHTPVAGIPRHTSSPAVTGTKKQPVSKASVTPNAKPKPSRSQVLASGKEHPSPVGSPKHVRSSRDSNPSKAKLQRQPSVVNSRSPSPYSNAQGSHKPLSRLSGTRQPLRRKSNNSSPAEVRRNNQHLKPELDCNSNSNNNNNNNSCFDEGERMMGFFTESAHFPDSSFLCPRRNESAPSLSPNSLQKVVRFSVGSASSRCSTESTDEDSCHLQSNLATRGESASPDQISSTSAVQPQADDQNEMLKSKVDEIRYHHSLQSLSLKHAKKRSPLEWKNFGLSWKQNSFPQTGLSQSRLLTSRTTMS